MDEQEWNDLTKDQQGDWIEYQNHNGDYFQSSYNGLVFKEDNPDD